MYRSLYASMVVVTSLLFFRSAIHSLSVLNECLFIFSAGVFTFLAARSDGK